MFGSDVVRFSVEDVSLVEENAEIKVKQESPEGGGGEQTEGASLEGEEEGAPENNKIYLTSLHLISFAISVWNHSSCLASKSLSRSVRRVSTTPTWVRKTAAEDFRMGRLPVLISRSPGL